MLTENRQNRLRLLHFHERHPRRRHHTLDNATLDQFNFICVPLNLEEIPKDSSLSQSNLTTITTTTTTTSLNGSPFSKTTELASPTRRVRFKVAENEDNYDLQACSSDDLRLPKKYSVHRVEFQIPIRKHPNPWLNVDCSSTPTTSAGIRALTSQKIDINYHNTMNTQDMTSLIDGRTPTIESDKTQTNWYKEMYFQLHKTPETKKDNQQNSYKPTYTFPEELDGDLERMEDYIRRVAAQDINDDDHKNICISSVRSSTVNVKDYQTIPKRDTEKTIRFDDRVSSPVERARPNNDPSLPSPTTTSKPLANHRPADDEQKLLYKRILRGGDIPSAGLQKFSLNNREKPEDPNLLEPPIQQTSQTQSSALLPIHKAIALHSFQAQTNRELPFKKGDTILVKRRINDDWFEGEHEGSIGIFPANHVDLVPLEEATEGEAIVKYDFIPQRTAELKLRKGEKVILLRKLDNHWYEGQFNNMHGIFPADYVEVLREPKDQIIKPEQTTAVSKMPKSVLKNSTALKRTAIERMNLVSEFSIPKQRCEVLYDYTPQNADELEIHVGDIIHIMEVCDDGWFCGVMEKTNYGNRMQFGTFPGNYVKILPV